jgi:hypothetical protein
MNSENMCMQEVFKRIKKLLYGINYEVSFFLYGPEDSDLSLIEVLKRQVSGKCELTGVVQSCAKEAIDDISEKVLYEGSTGSGPLKIESKKKELTSLLNEFFNFISFEEAEIVCEFGLRQGHPAYPVFWDFAYDIHSQNRRWILIGSSSD